MCVGGCYGGVGSCFGGVGGCFDGVGGCFGGVGGCFGGVGSCFGGVGGCLCGIGGWGGVSGGIVSNFLIKVSLVDNSAGLHSAYGNLGGTSPVTSGVVCSITEELPLIINTKDLGVFAGVPGGEVSEEVGVYVIAPVSSGRGISSSYGYSAVLLCAKLVDGHPVYLRISSSLKV